MFGNFILWVETIISDIFGYFSFDLFLDGIPIIMFFIVMILLDVFWNFTPFDDD